MGENFYRSLSDQIHRLIDINKIGYLIEHEAQFLAKLILNDRESHLLVKLNEPITRYISYEIEFENNIYKLHKSNSSHFYIIEHYNQYFTLNRNYIKKVQIPRMIVNKISNVALPSYGPIWFVNKSDLNNNINYDHYVSSVITLPQDWLS